GQWFKSPVARMVFSNFAATIIGSGIVFFVAFTDWFFINNSMARPVHEVVVGWLAQSFFIWASSIALGVAVEKVKNVIAK
ncbi:MAG: hypothetical protein ACRC5T_09135, partial [Cetobacterium sp.]